MNFQAATGKADGELQPQAVIDPGSAIYTESWLKPYSSIRIRRILVPLDFSVPSRKALQYAIAIARDFDAEVILLNVVHPYPVIPDLPAATPQMNAMLKAEAAEGLADIVSKVRGVRMKPIVRAGSAAHEIVAEADLQNVDLIILNTHGRTGLSHVLLGSVAEHVVRLAKCPVLTLRAFERDFINIPVDDAGLNQIARKPQAKISEHKEKEVV